VPITASAGLAMFRPNDSIEDVYKRADKALYRAKQEGRNRCIAED
jgi:diguanylate cyclase